MPNQVWSDEGAFSDTWEGFPIAPSVLKRAEPDVNVVLLSEVVVDGGTVPAPAVIAGLQAKKPLGSLFSPRHHVGEVLHHTAHVVFVDV